MNEIVVIVEGHSEYALVERILQPHFWQWDTHVWPRLPGRIHRRGGVRRWQAIKDDILRSLKERRDRICTTMFDFYAMPPDWPGRVEAAGYSWRERGSVIEQALHTDIVKSAGSDFDASRFVPYIQIHEFEALLFCDLNITARTLSAQNPAQEKTVTQRLKEVIASVSSPEEINDDPSTAPSKRIAQIEPGYHKTLHGPIIVEATGLRNLRNSCENFNRWITRLEAAVQDRIEKPK